MLVLVTSGYAQAGLESRAFGGREERGSSEEMRVGVGAALGTPQPPPPETQLSQDLLFPFWVEFCVFVSFD